MTKSIAHQLARREVEAHRRHVVGVTATVPAYVVVDSAGTKEWVVDVYLGPLELTEVNIARNIPIASIAKELVTDVRQPVLLERSKQGKYTVVGRSKTLPSGAQMPEGSILDPTYHRIEYNLAELRLSFIADLTYTLEPWGVKTWGDVGKPWQQVTAVDAFGRTIAGPDVLPADVPPALDPTPVKVVTTRHVILTRKTWGPVGSADALVWGKDPWGAPNHKVVELIT